MCISYLISSTGVTPKIFKPDPITKPIPCTNARRARVRSESPSITKRGLPNGSAKYAVDGYKWLVDQGCVIVAGVFGAATASKKILYVQALPGALALRARALRMC